MGQAAERLNAVLDAQSKLPARETCSRECRSTTENQWEARMTLENWGQLIGILLVIGTALAFWFARK